MDCRTPGFPDLCISRSLLQLLSIESVMPSNRLVLCHPFLPSIFPTLRSFLMSRLWIRRPKYWSFSISPSNEYSGLISFRIDWFDLLAIQLVHWRREWQSTAAFFPLNPRNSNTLKGKERLTGHRICNRRNWSVGSTSVSSQPTGCSGCNPAFEEPKGYQVIY